MLSGLKAAANKYFSSDSPQTYSSGAVQSIHHKNYLNAVNQGNTLKSQSQSKSDIQDECTPPNLVSITNEDLDNLKQENLNHKSIIERLNKELSDKNVTFIVEKSNWEKNKTKEINDIKNQVKIEKLNHGKHKTEIANFKLEIENLNKELSDTKNKLFYEKSNLDRSIKDNEIKTKELNDFKTKQTISWNDRDIQFKNVIKTIDEQKNIIKNLETEYRVKIESLNEDKRLVQENLMKVKAEIEGYKNVISKLNSQLNEKELIIEKGNETLKKEKDRVAEKASTSGLENKSKETQLNSQLPMAADISNTVETFIHIMEDYYMNSDFLEKCKNQQLASILNVIMMASYGQCIIKFKNTLEHLLGSDTPNSNQLYQVRCLVYSSIDRYINETSEIASEKLEKLFITIHSTTAEMESAKKFILDCCKFVWTVLLSQPEVKFNDDEYKIQNEPVLYSKVNHNSFESGSVNCKMCVHLTIIPSIQLVRDNSLLSKSYVFLKSTADNTIINITKEAENQIDNSLNEQVSNYATPATAIVNNNPDPVVDKNECIIDDFDHMDIEKEKECLPIFNHLEPALYNHPPPATNCHYSPTKRSQSVKNIPQVHDCDSSYYYGDQSNNTHHVYSDSQHKSNNPPCHYSGTSHHIHHNSYSHNQQSSSCINPPPGLSNQHTYVDDSAKNQL